jgi:hypothetical protein
VFNKFLFFSLPRGILKSSIIFSQEGNEGTEDSKHRWHFRRVMALHSFSRAREKKEQTEKGQ